MIADNFAGKQRIDFHRKRDFGELFNATFQFIREEFSTMIKPIIYVAVPLMLLSMFVIVMSYVITDGMSSIATQIFEFLSQISTNILYICLMSVGYAYVKLYIAGEETTSSKVMEIFWKNIAPMIGYTILIGILSSLGFLFLIIPGIYLAVTLQFVYPLKFVDEDSLDAPIKESFYVVKNYWWFTFGCLFVLSIIVLSVSMLIQLPGLLILGTEMWTGLDQLEYGMSDNMIIGLMLVSILDVIASITFIIPLVFMTLHYFNIKERKEETTLMSNIGTINEKNDFSDNIQD